RGGELAGHTQRRRRRVGSAGRRRRLMPEHVDELPAPAALGEMDVVVELHAEDAPRRHFGLDVEDLHGHLPIGRSRPRCIPAARVDQHLRVLLQDRHAGPQIEAALVEQRRDRAFHPLRRVPVIALRVIEDGLTDRRRVFIRRRFRLRPREPRDEDDQYRPQTHAHLQGDEANGRLCARIENSYSIRNLIGVQLTRYSAVASRLGTLIERGTLRAGDRLPSLRRTSRREGVSLTTSLQAYALLESRGYIEARPQSGFFVRPSAVRSISEPLAAAPRRGSVRVGLAALAMRVLEGAQDPSLVPLGAACPSSGLLPARKLARFASLHVRRAPAEANSYAFPPGRLELRREIARRAVDWGGTLTPDAILVTCGATEALHLALRAVTNRGDLVAVESPAYFGTLLILETLGLRAVEILTDPRDGLRLDALKEALARRRIAALVASPVC